MCLECNQPPWLNIAQTIAIKRLHPISKGPRCSIGRRYDHRSIKEVALWITCRKFGLAHLLNTTSFRQFQIIQTKAQTPTQICSFVFLSIPFNQLPNRLVIFMGGSTLNVKCTTFQTRREKWQEMNRWLIRLQRIYNFWCSMLVFTPFAYCFITLRGTFMYFPELTY
jgi:hypothetical protein